MRTCKRNEQSLWYANYSSKTAAVDVSSNKTGEWTKTYSTPVNVKVNVQGVSSKYEVELFGVHAINMIRVVSESTLPITGESIIWFGITPPSPYTATAPKHNYVVEGIPTVLNDFVFYARKVDVT